MRSVSLGLRKLAMLAHVAHNPIHTATTWTFPIPGMSAPACVALLASGIVHVLALWAFPVIRMAMDPLAILAGGEAVVAATWAEVVPLMPLLNKRAASAACGHCASEDMLAVQVGTLNAAPCLLVMRLRGR